MHRPIRLTLSALVCLLAVPATAKTARLTDAQIFAVLTAANTGEIDAANLAQSKAGNPDVKTFAADMLKDHTAMNDEGSALASRLGIVPADSAVSDHLKKEGAKELKKLSAMTGQAFDEAYVRAQVADHTHVLALFDTKLIPSAKNPELKTMLEKARPTIAAHLKHARETLAALKKNRTAMGQNP